MDAFAFVYCNVAFHISRVCKLHVCFMVLLVHLLFYYTFSLRVIVYALAFVWCNLAFHIAVVGIACSCCFCVVALCLLVCVFCV